VIDGIIIEAVVQVGAQETRYLRCGRGEQVVVVLAAGEDERLSLMQEYSVAHRVIAPVPWDRSGWRIHVGSDAVGSWLDGVIDGLGLERPTVVLASDVAWMAEWLDGSGDGFMLTQVSPGQERTAPGQGG
jgi:hypothetical protein